MDLNQFQTQFAAGEFIFREGDSGDCAYIIETGIVEVSVQKDERKLVIATLTEGDLLGEMAIIDRLPRTGTAVALEQTRLIAIPHDYIHQKVDCSDPTVRFFLQIVLERYRDVHARLMHVFEGIAEPGDKEYQEIYATTTNVGRRLMTQYLDLQDRILSAVNTPDDDDHRGHDDQTAWHAKQMLEAEQALTHALAADEFCLQYQPIVDLRSQRVVGCEALVRWQHPNKDLLLPAEFIAQAENTGLIVELGYWIATEACAFLRRLGDAVESPLFVSINLSGRQFEDPELIPRLEQIMVDAGVESSRVKYEITETLLMATPDLANEYLHKIKATGAQLAIDDFGTGYSSFSYLHQFPFDTLKIDRTFVSTMIPNRKSQQIVKSLVHLSHDLNMDVIAEGVESGFEESLLLELGAEQAQGFHYSRPLDGDALIAQLRK